MDQYRGIDTGSVSVFKPERLAINTLFGLGHGRVFAEHEHLFEKPGSVCCVVIDW